MEQYNTDWASFIRFSIYEPGNRTESSFFPFCTEDGDSEKELNRVSPADSLHGCFAQFSNLAMVESSLFEPQFSPSLLLARWIFPTFLPSLLFQFRFPLPPAHFRRFCHCFTGVSPKSSHLSPDFRLKGLQLSRDLAKTDVLSARVIERRGRQLSFGKCTLARDSYLEAGRLLARLGTCREYYFSPSLKKGLIARRGDKCVLIPISNYPIIHTGGKRGRSHGIGEDSPGLERESVGPPTVFSSFFGLPERGGREGE